MTSVSARSASAAALAVVVATTVAACQGAASKPAPYTAVTAAPKPAAAGSPPARRPAHLLPGMPPPLSPRDIYAADRPGALSPVVRAIRPLVYVPDTWSRRVDVIDPQTYRVIRRIPVGQLPQHVVPSWDLRTLWVNNNVGNTVTPINPRNGHVGRPVPVADPYNLYFTPNGQYAVVMAERNRRIDFRDPHTMRLARTVRVPCQGVNHADFSADGRFLVASCEFSAQLVKVDSTGRRLLATLRLPGHAMPQDVKLSPDGKVFYVADMQTGGVWLIDAARFRVLRFVRTGLGAHGLYVSRDSRLLYVTNRTDGSISVVSFASRRVVRTWAIPGGGSPDMGGVSADGRVLWLSGRYHNVVYAIDVVHWRLIRRIPVGGGPHGLCVYPQPGRYSLGHTGVFR